MRRIIILGIFLLCINCFSVVGLSQVNDNENNEEVKQLIVKLINNQINIWEKTTLENKLNKLGDRGVKILTKEIDASALKDSKFIVNVFIPVVCYSFEKPNEIEKDFDKQGLITLSTINLIIDNCVDIGVKKEMSRLKFLIRQHFVDDYEIQP